jgi:hypothetical protein
VDYQAGVQRQKLEAGLSRFLIIGSNIVGKVASLFFDGEWSKITLIFTILNLVEYFFILIWFPHDCRLTLEEK